MLHTVEQLIKRINVMHTKAIELHRLRNQYSKLSGKEYDKITCQALLDDIQSMAKLIAEDRQGNEIKTDMDEWKKKDTVIITEDDGYHD
jgi:mRNA-degrading endonuclease toxin of MazEF toxin-antitoxin module